VSDSSNEHSTRQILIEATAQRLWDVDESELRILEICQATNLSTSVIYGHFGSRQGLIDASLLHVFSIVTDQLVDNLTTVLSGAHPKGSFVDTLYDLLTDPAHEADVTSQRQMFLRVSATALSRPSIRPGFLELYERYMKRMDAMYGELVRRQLLNDQLTGHQWAIFFEGQMLSRAFHDLSSGWDSQGDWLRAAEQMLSAAKPNSPS
jgi:AcrR family transcriptional regulator